MKKIQIQMAVTLAAFLAFVGNAQAAPIFGQVVRITQNKPSAPNVLQLAEIQVFEDVTLTNLALAGTASQSSQLGGFGPGNAIDGNLGNFQHTLDLAGGGQTWEVDLGGSFALDSVGIHSRIGCCNQGRTADIQLQIFSDAAATNLVHDEQVLGLGNNLEQSRLITLPRVADPVVPEPASIAIWSLLGLCLAGYGYRRRRSS